MGGALYTGMYAELKGLESVYQAKVTKISGDALDIRFLNSRLQHCEEQRGHHICLNVHAHH